MKWKSFLKKFAARSSSALTCINFCFYFYIYNMNKATSKEDPHLKQNYFWFKPRVTYFFLVRSPLHFHEKNGIILFFHNTMRKFCLPFLRKV